MKSKIEIADVPGVGTVAATIKYDVLANGSETNRVLADARYASGGLVENEHRAAVGETFRALT